MNDLHNRRTFLRAAAVAGAAWATADLAHVEEALAWAGGQAGKADATLTVLTKAQADVLDALTSRILPAVDARPGAHDAGVVYFIDRALATFNANQKQVYGDGIADLNRRAGLKSKASTTFAALTPWGGNRDYAGWHMLGFEHQPAFQPPFGYYDAEINKRG